MSEFTRIELLRRSPHVAEVWLNRPDVRNAFDEVTIAELTRAFTQLGQDAGLRAVLLGGRGKAFSAGADLNWMRRMADFTWEQNRADSQALADMLHTIHVCPVPVVARLHGDCYAGGVGLATVCDILVASREMQFCLSEARLGLMPANISPYVIRAMGESAARRYFVTAERFSAEEAHRLGMVHELTDAAGLDAAVDALLATLVRNGPQALRHCKRLVREVAGRALDDELRADTAARIADVRASPEGKEGIQSFLGKREPSWLP